MKNNQKNALGLGVGLMLALALSARAEANATFPATPPIDVVGQQTVAALQQQYAYTTDRCRSGAAFQCSGILLRAVSFSPNYHFWAPSPASQQSGGISFSWLRADSRFSKLAFGMAAGYLLYPAEQAPSGALPVTVKCFFPQDGFADGRNNQGGCGENSYYPGTSRPCPDQGIVTSQQWIRHYRSGGEGYADRHRHQCAFTMTNRYRRVDQIRFAVGLRAQNALGQESLHEQNEIRTAAWSAEEGKALPLQAFFYTQEYGRETAQSLQQDYYTTTQRWVPVIRMNLPQNEEEQVEFSYTGQDQRMPATLHP